MSVIVTENGAISVISVIPAPETVVITDNTRIGPQGPVGNLVFISENGEQTITSNLINFVNTATITVDVIQDGMNANIAFTAVGGAAFDQANAAFNQANAAYLQANSAYDAANNAQVTVYANNESNVTTQNVNFVNTATVTVTVSADGANANIEFTAAPQTVVNDTYTAAGNTAAAATANIANGLYAISTSAYDQANTAYEAANNAKVTVFANNSSNVITQNLNFVNTSTVSVSVSADSSNANVAFDLTELQYNTSSISPEVIDSWNAAIYRSGKYQMQVENFLGFLATDLMILHDGNTTNLTLFGSSQLGGNTGLFTADLNSGFVRLFFTPSDSSTNLTFTRKLLQNRSVEILPTDLMLGINTYDLMNILYFQPTDLNA